MDPAKELLERDLLGGGLSKATPRTGLWSVAGTISVEAKAQGTEGTAPEYGLLMEGTLGNTRSVVTKTTSDTEGGTYSDTVLCLDAVDASGYTAGDIIVIKRAGEYHISPITNVATNEVTILVADPAGAFVDGLAIAALTTYYPGDEDHKAISVSRYIEDAIVEKSVGSKMVSMAMSGFETGAMAKFEFGFEGLYPDREVSAIGYTPSFDSALPPIILSACIYQDGVALPVNSVGFSVENELGKITSTCAAKGTISSRVTGRGITGTIDPYKQNDDIAQWEKFEDGDEYSIFGYAKVPTGVTGEYGDVFAFYMPYCLSTELGEGDQDGILKDSITFNAGGGSDQDEEIFISFI